MAGLKLGGWRAAAGSLFLSAAVIAASAEGGVADKDKKEAATGETRMTREQAKELFKSVDEIMAFASKDSKLPIQHSVKRTLISRDEVNKFLRQRFDKDESTKRLERSEIVLKKFGLLDQDFHLGPFLVSLLTEQIAGFYDDKTKTVNLLDWIAPDDQKGVLAHELTHALQDQKVDLTRWSEVGPNGVAKNHNEDVEHIHTDEADTAREAVTEGQAMAVFVDYGLKDSGKTIADAPDMGEKLKALTEDTGGSPLLERAPLLLQKSLLFPYSDGLAFEHRVLVKAGRDAAFTGVLGRPPSSSFEILHPDAYLEHTPVPVLRMPDIHPLIDAEFAPYDEGVMGELDVQIIAELFGGPQIAAALAPAWKGGIYYAAQRKTATAAQKETTGSLGIFYYSKWENEDSARSFMRIYSGSLARKYSGLKRRNKDEKDDGEEVYSTNEGDVLLALKDDQVFVAEGFDLALARKLRDGVEEVQSSGPMQVAGVRQVSPAMSLVQMMGQMGVMKAALDGRYTR